MDAVLVYEHSDLREHQKAALRYTDAFLADPGGFGPDARADLLEHFGSGEIVELTFKLTEWTCNRAFTALGLDEPVDDARPTAFDYDGDGELYLIR
jgi:alkylhydroperoxidase family enzyme